MKLQNQILIVNVAIVAELAFEYFRGSPTFSIIVTGASLLLLANVIFVVRVRKAKKSR
jgi:hypothetical protein